MRVLGIETSCDETGVAIYDNNSGLVAHRIYSQRELHACYGGVVPELASRNHVKKIVPLIKNMMLESGLVYKDISAVAYTAGPGLIGSLMVGATVGHSFAYALRVPVIKVHHIEGHMLTPMLEGNTLEFPIISLVVSGGHTQLIFIDSIGRYKILGASLDDAVGEVFDKIAKLLGIRYPGGATLSKIARQGRPGRYIFPRPMINSPSLDFSFSGLKTCVSNVILQGARDNQTRADIARAFEDSILDVLSAKCQRALDLMNCKFLLLAGGVSANVSLRDRLASIMEHRGGKIFCATPNFCTDNAAMIAYVGLLRYKLGLFKNNDLSILVKPRWSIEDVMDIY